MLLSIFNLCLFVIGIVMDFFDVGPIVDVIYWCVLIPPLIDALVHSLIYQKQVFRCKNCGKEFQQPWHRLFGKFAPWKLPRRICNGEEVESRFYGKAWVTCPCCGSWDCFVEKSVK